MDEGYQRRGFSRTIRQSPSSLVVSDERWAVHHGGGQAVFEAGGG